MCYGLPECTQSRRACFYCLIVLLLEVTTLMFWWLSYYCSKDMLSEFAYMLAGRNTSHGVKFCESLPTAHVLTRCDSTSSLYRIGKCVTNTNLQDLVENGNQFFTTFGIQANVDLDVFSVHSFVLSLYEIKASNCFLLGQLRYFLASTTDKPNSHLTPTEDAFKQHVPRARYQTNI